MSKRYYKKHLKKDFRKYFRMFGLGMLTFGFLGIIYVSFPLLSWQFYFAAFASESVLSPIPENQEDLNVSSLITASADKLTGVDFTKAENWYPSVEKDVLPARVSIYTITIPKIKVIDAVVSTEDTDLSRHMVQYNSTATPPEKGNAIVFGHSTLPQLYNPKDYKTILAKAYFLKKGDSLIANVNGVSYLYKIENVRVVSAEDTSIFNQKRDDSYLTIVTCTPPGTIWKRLVLTARLQPL